ncbi:hypothetical protein QE152_g34213 [Popillia japonica]|uniref:Uncharacterized protein n=1 Tax=Popillia japonica TaxID=7064 RepID=A0AAW1IUN9_POPJA
MVITGRLQVTINLPDQEANHRPTTSDYQPSGSGSSPSGGRYIEPTDTRYPSGSGSHTSGQNYYTTGTIHFPSSSSNYPSSSSHNYPSSSNTYPSSSNTYPSTSNTYPSSSNNYPSPSNNNHPSNSNNYPSTSHTYPSGGGGSNYQQSNYQTSQSRESSYRAAAGHREAGIEYTQGSSRPQTDYQAELIDIRDQVQNDLTRQLNTAIENQKQASTSYSTTSVSSNQVLADLSAELKRNLTQKIEQTLAEHSRRGNTGGYSVTFSTSGNINPGNYNREQLTTLMNQLQEDLLHFRKYQSRQL